MKTLEKQILEKISNQGVEYEKKNQKVSYNDLFDTLMHQSVYEAVSYIFEQEDNDKEFYIGNIFNGVSEMNKNKVLEMDDIVDFVVKSFECFNHRDRYDIFGVTEEGWGAVHEVMNQVFRYHVPE